jgi:hypothetical protein
VKNAALSIGRPDREEEGIIVADALLEALFRELGAGKVTHRFSLPSRTTTAQFTASAIMLAGS